MTDARKRIAELEEALRPFAGLLEVWQAAHDAEASTCSYRYKSAADMRASNSEAADAGDQAVSETIMRDWIIHAAAILEQTETPAQETGDVERVKAALRTAFSRLFDEGPTTAEERIDAYARAALAAMRPVSVDEGKLAEIRARHEHLDGQLSKRTTEITAYEGYSAHADRAFLLSALEGVNHDD